MSSTLRLLTLSVALLALALSAVSQNPGVPAPRDPLGDNDIKLPNGKSMRQEMAKADYDRNVKDLQTLARLATEARDEMQATDRYVVSLKTVKKLEEIEKLSKTVRSRLTRF